MIVKEYWMTMSWGNAYIREKDNGEATLTVYDRKGNLHHFKTYSSVKAAKAVFTRKYADD